MFCDSFKLIFENVFLVYMFDWPVAGHADPESCAS